MKGWCASDKTYTFPGWFLHNRIWTLTNRLHRKGYKRSPSSSTFGRQTVRLLHIVTWYGGSGGWSLCVCVRERCRSHSHLQPAVAAAEVHLKKSRWLRWNGTVCQLSPTWASSTKTVSFVTQLIPITVPERDPNPAGLLPTVLHLQAVGQMLPVNCMNRHSEGFGITLFWWSEASRTALATNLISPLQLVNPALTVLRVNIFSINNNSLCSGCRWHRHAWRTTHLGSLPYSPTSPDSNWHSPCSYLLERDGKDEHKQCDLLCKEEVWYLVFK